MADQDDQYTWLEFKNAVLDMLTIDKERAGIESFRTGLIRQGVIRLQSLIPEFRIGHETIYHPSDLVMHGRASIGTKPPQSAIQDVFLCKIDAANNQCDRFATDPWDWSDRMMLVHGNVSVNNGRAKFCIDPRGYEFYVYPAVYDCDVLSMFWDGLKHDFQDSELTPFTEDMVMAVADFVKAKIARHVERDIEMHNSFLSSFNDAAGILFIKAKEKARTKG